MMEPFTCMILAIWHISCRVFLANLLPLLPFSRMMVSFLLSFSQSSASYGFRKWSTGFVFRSSMDHICLAYLLFISLFFREDFLQAVCVTFPSFLALYKAMAAILPALFLVHL
uniref:Uncharacterized protein n=1 Tax=Cacopsylla melanoneura TaxID=428564 RepID=A0A8D9EY59_9HEMI